MKSHPILIALLLVLAGSFYGSANLHADESGREEPRFATQYLIELSEYELEQAIPLNLSEAEVVDAILHSGAKPIETIRMTAVADTPSFVKFGRRISVTTATMTNGNNTARQTKEIEIGTLLRTTIRPHAKGAVADIDYSTERVDGDGTDDSPPDILTSVMQSTQLYTLGESRLLSTVGVGKLTAVVVTVREIPRPLE